MKIILILAILAASCIVGYTQESQVVSCYQCQDMAIEYVSESNVMQMNETMDDSLPRCDSYDMTNCPYDGSSYMCGAVSISYDANMFGVTMKAEMVTRVCLPSVGLTNQAMEETYCNAMEDALTGSSDGALDFTSCKLDVCRTDNCNTQGMEKFQDDGDKENDGEENYEYVSSGSKLAISFLLIQLVSFLAVTVL